MKGLVGGGLKLVERFGDEAYFAALCVRSGLVRPELPHRVAQMLLAFERYGMLAGAITIGAIRNGDRVALRDERGDVTYKELDERSNALANAWRERGLKPGDGVAILVRNHRGFLDAVFAAAKCGAKIILLNTSFAGPQIREVAEREGTDLLVYDDEYSEMLEGVELPVGRFRAWADEDANAAPTTRSSADRGGVARQTRPSPMSAPKIVILTSGTTGTPKGAPRGEPRVAGDGRRPAQQGPVPRPRDHRAMRADVPRARLRADGARAGARLDARRAPPLRSRADARQPRRTTRSPR